ncbi:GLIPR1-like protein 1 [Centruroides sculpturatus]|uniref:GLIPR1-like protein 1 n=1 Tax=Centruroides sculpturatus TaxID=218467 RepID=UPI000C6D14CC|nr:GLIPR1-like protein 1 [Centruroides sculpturatus]
MKLAKYLIICLFCSIGKLEGFFISVNASQYFIEHSSLLLSNFTKEEEKNVLGHINLLRENVEPGSSNMNVLMWSDDLAKIAKDWGDKCIFESGPKSCLKHFSQNIYYGSKSHQEALTQWYRQKNLYDYDTNVCNGFCDRYKTVVWAETTTVGCSLSHCKKDGSVHVIICNFYPAIEDLSQRPYKKGNSCEECENKDKCDFNLCVPKNFEISNETAFCTQSVGLQSESEENIAHRISSEFFLLNIAVNINHQKK